MKDWMYQKNKCVPICTMMDEIYSSLLLERNCQWITSNDGDGDFITELTQLSIARQLIILTASFLIMQK